mmetsp:Transcript_1470/g.4359  ORF Transcript_1470/g.4359 Transcript_1470/m.4359 type:complete len:209 (-) Transcript_1470:629-1255(-)
MGAPLRAAPGRSAGWPRAGPAFQTEGSSRPRSSGAGRTRPSSASPRARTPGRRGSTRPESRGPWHASPGPPAPCLYASGAPSPSWRGRGRRLACRRLGTHAWRRASRCPSSRTSRTPPCASSMPLPCARSTQGPRQCVPAPSTPTPSCGKGSRRIRAPPLESRGCTAPGRTASRAPRDAGSASSGRSRHDSATSPSRHHHAQRRVART